MTRDLSDWDPLPAEETGLHPGEAQKFLRAAEPRPVPQEDAFAVVRSTMPTATGTRRAANTQPSMRPTGIASPAASAPMLPSVPAIAAPQSARAASATATAPERAVAVSTKPVGPSHASPRRDAKPSISRELPGDVLSAMARPADAMRPMPAALMETVPVSARKPVANSIGQQAPKLADKQDATARLFALAPAESGLDPRAREPWYLAMPVVEQLRLSRAWQQDRDAASSVAAQQAPRGQRMLERFWVAYVVFFVAALPLMLTEGLMGFVRMAMAGCVTGLLWQIVPHTRRACAVSAVSAYAAVALVPRLGELSAAPFALLNALGGAALVYYLAGLGAAHEERVDALADHAD